MLIKESTDERFMYLFPFVLSCILISCQEFVDSKRSGITKSILARIASNDSAHGSKLSHT